MFLAYINCSDYMLSAYNTIDGTLTDHLYKTSMDILNLVNNLIINIGTIITKLIPRSIQGISLVLINSF